MRSTAASVKEETVYMMASLRGRRRKVDDLRAVAEEGVEAGKPRLQRRPMLQDMSIHSLLYWGCP